MKMPKITNRKGVEMSLSTVVVALILIFVAFAILAVFTDIFGGKQVPWLRGQTETATSDCDGDGIIGVTDRCPCDPEIRDKSEKCGQASSISVKNCPNLCKNEKSTNA